MEFSQSLKKNHLFRRLYRNGKSVANGSLVLYCRKNGQGINRIGITASGKLGCAVKRNLLRRRLWAIYRIHEADFACGYDLVLVCRSRSITATYVELESSYLALAKRLKVLVVNSTHG